MNYRIKMVSTPIMPDARARFFRERAKFLETTPPGGIDFSNVCAAYRRMADRIERSTA